MEAEERILLFGVNLLEVNERSGLNVSEKERIKRLLETFEMNEEWFSENYERLEKDYADKVLAIKDRNIIAASRKVEDLLNELKMKNEDIDLVFIASIPPKGIAFIL